MNTTNDIEESGNNEQPNQTPRNRGLSSYTTAAFSGLFRLSARSVLSDRSAAYRATKRFPAFKPARESVNPEGNVEDAVNKYRDTEQGKFYEHIGVGVPKSPAELEELKRREMEEANQLEKTGSKSKRNLKWGLIGLFVVVAIIGVVVGVSSGGDDEDDDVDRKS